VVKWSREGNEIVLDNKCFCGPRVVESLIWRQLKIRWGQKWWGGKEETRGEGDGFLLILIFQPLTPNQNIN